MLLTSSDHHYFSREVVIGTVEKNPTGNLTKPLQQLWHAYTRRTVHWLLPVKGIKTSHEIGNYSQDAGQESLTQQTTWSPSYMNNSYQDAWILGIRQHNKKTKNRQSRRYCTVKYWIYVNCEDKSDRLNTFQNILNAVSNQDKYLLFLHLCDRLILMKCPLLNFLKIFFQRIFIFKQHKSYYVLFSGKKCYLISFKEVPQTFLKISKHP